jgi:hypothetical protein
MFISPSTHLEDLQPTDENSDHDIFRRMPWYVLLTCLAGLRVLRIGMMCFWHLSETVHSLTCCESGWASVDDLHVYLNN